MKVTVRIEERYFEVEIGSLYTRPIVAVVEGERFEIWPEGGFVELPLKTAKSAPLAAAPSAAVGVAASPATQPRNVKAVHAPIPGLIISVAVKPGDTVEVGQELCILEAMKMKNIIRAPRPGEIARVMVAAGEQVQHHDLLMEYVD